MLSFGDPDGKQVLKGKRVRIPRGPAAVSEVSFSRCHWNRTGKAKKTDARSRKTCMEAFLPGEVSGSGSDL